MCEGGMAMKKLRPKRHIMTAVVVTGVIASCLLAFALWAVVQFHIAVAVGIALGLSALIALAMYLVTDKGISFDEEKFVVKGGREYYYHEIDEVKVKTSEFYYKHYKAIVVDGEEVCIFDDLYQNVKEFTAILEKHGFTVPTDNRMFN